MKKTVNAAFEMQPVTVQFDCILPSKSLHESVKATDRYRAIASSVAEVGIIEPLVVCRQKGGKFLLLDGHVRLAILRDLGKTETTCLVSTEDEAYTYNHQISRLPPIHANRMIVRALEAGVSAERLARALNLNVNTVRASRNLLKGICPEAQEILKDKPVTEVALRLLKQVKPIRQIEMAELMATSATYTKPYVEALVLMTPKEQLVAPEKPKKNGAARPEELTRVEHEMKGLERSFAALDESYGQNVVELTLARSYLKKLLDNGKVVRYLAGKHSDLLNELQRIVEAVSLEG